MTWMQTYGGRRWDLLDPKPESVDWYDLAWQLAQQCRFNGACRPYYSVAEHCVRVADLLPASLGIYGLLHDAHEGPIGDWISGVKKALKEIHPEAGKALDLLAKRQDFVIYQAAGLPWPLKPEDAAWIKHADLVMLATEKRDVMAKPEDPVMSKTFGLGVDLPPPHPQQIVPWSIDEAATEWLLAFDRHIVAWKAHQ